MAPHAGDPTSGPPLRVLVVEDETPAQARLRNLLGDRDDIELIGICASRDAAVRLIQTEAPDVVFLDHELRSGTAVDVIQAVGMDQMPLTIFVTAHDDFAVESFEFDPVDFLLKPYTDQRFEQALARARRRRPRGRARRPARHAAERLFIPMRGQVKIVPLESVDYVRASGVYCEVHAGAQRYLLRTPLTSLEEQLGSEHFFRVHRSVIVRLDRIESLLRESGGVRRVRLRSGQVLPVGRTRRVALESLLGRA